MLRLGRKEDSRVTCHENRWYGDMLGDKELLCCVEFELKAKQ